MVIFCFIRWVIDKFENFFNTSIWLGHSVSLTQFLVSCGFVNIPFDVLCQVWYSVVSIPDLAFFHT